MNIKVCDALCGQGKTMACINMMNNDTENRYIFITPYLSEVERIRLACAGRKFCTPQWNPKTGCSKLRDTISLLRAGKNIVSTHALFSYYTDEVKRLIREKGYILVLDEVIDLFQTTDMDSGDIEFLFRFNALEKDGADVVWTDDCYEGEMLKEIQKKSSSRNLIEYGGNFYFWSLPIDLFTCFKDAYVLTYLFQYQILKYYFDSYGLDYELIGVKQENGIYQFCPANEMNRKVDLSQKIHIIENPKYNDIGREYYALSSGWFQRAAKEEGQPGLETLRNDVISVFRRFKNDTKREGLKMWTTFNRHKNDLKGKGYTKGFVPFNQRASNDNADKKYLAYCLNVFMFPWMKNYLYKLGVKKVSQDMYALSVLIQWIFRSALRKGEEVWIYVPSRRMRHLLIDWIDNLRKGCDLKEIKYDTGKLYKGDIYLQRTIRRKK